MERCVAEHDAAEQQRADDRAAVMAKKTILSVFPAGGHREISWDLGNVSDEVHQKLISDLSKDTAWPFIIFRGEDDGMIILNREQIVSIQLRRVECE